MLFRVAGGERDLHGRAEGVRCVVRRVPRLPGAVRHQLQQEVCQPGLTCLPFPAWQAASRTMHLRARVGQHARGAATTHRAVHGARRSQDIHGVLYSNTSTHGITVAWQLTSEHGPLCFPRLQRSPARRRYVDTHMGLSRTWPAVASAPP